MAPSDGAYGEIEMTVTAGDYEPGALLLTMDNNATAITKGKLLKADTTNGGVVLTTADASEEGPWYVAAETVTSTGQNVACVAGGTVWVTADGAIKVGNLVQAASATAGEVIAYVETAASDADSALQHKRVVGRYLGHENEIARRAVATDAADGDIIAILMGGNSQ